jgi:RimJ/RimL family protein N-acetyltransferase
VWAVVERETDALIGHCGLRYLEDTSDVELLYGLGRRFWGRGVATEAGRASLGYGFEQAGLSRIVALAKPENAASRRVMEKLGMTFEGEAHHFGLVAVRYAISRDQFRPSV